LSNIKNKHNKNKPVIVPVPVQRLTPVLGKIIANNVVLQLVLSGIIAVWAYVLAKNYFAAYPVDFNALNLLFTLPARMDKAAPGFVNVLVSSVLAIAGAKVLFLAAYGYGAMLNRYVLKLEYHNGKEEFVFDSGIGLGLLIVIFLATGIIGLFSLGTAIFLLGIGFVFLVLNLKKVVENAKSFLPKSKLAVNEITALCVLFIALIAVLAGSLVPETFYDSMKYHLGVPLQWVLGHKIAPIEDFEYSYYPLNIQVLYGAVMLYGNDITAKLVHYIIGVLLLMTVYTIARKYFSRATGIYAMFILYTIPMAMIVAWKTAVEHGLGLFETLAVYAFLNAAKFIENGGEQQNQFIKWLVLSGAFAGLAIGGKYTSVYCLIALMIAITGYYILKRKVVELKKVILAVVVIGVISVLTVSPWLVRNAVLTGNPTYPYVVSPTQDIGVKHKNSVVAFTDPGPPDRSIKNFVTLPWTLTMGTNTQEPHSGVILLLLLPFTLLWWKTKPELKFLLIYSVIYCVIWFMVRTYFRYLTPVLPVASIVLAYYLTENNLVKFVKTVLLLFVIFLGFRQVYSTVFMEKMSMDPLPYLLGMESRYSYLSTQRPTYPCPYYPATDWMNKNMPVGSKIAFLGECRGLYSKHKVVVQTIGDESPLVRVMRESNNMDEFYDNLVNKMKVTHFMLNLPEAKRLAGYDMFNWDNAGQLRIFNEFWVKHVRLIHKTLPDITLDNQRGYRMSDIPQYWEKYVADPTGYLYIYEIVKDKQPAGQSGINEYNMPVNWLLMPGLYPEARKKMLGL